MPIQVSKVTHNNNGHFYRIAIDIAKEGSEVWDLTPYFKGRVGDDNFGLQIVWYYQGRLLDVTGKTPYIKGNVGHYSFDDKKDLQLAPDADVVVSHGNPNDCQANGQATYYFPQQMFMTDGVFKGFIGLQDDNQNLTGVDIWFRVLPGVARMGHACDVYVDVLDKTIADFKEKIRQQSIDFDTALNQELQNEKDLIQQKLDAASGAIDTDNATLQKLAASAGTIQAQIDANDIITRADFKALDDRVAARLSQIKLSPAAFANFDDLKAKFPNGNDNLNVAVDTGHLWIWFNGAWKDCGQYQTAGLEVEVLKPLKQAIAALFNKASQHESRLSAHDYVLTNQEQRLDNDNIRIKDNQTRVENIEGVGSLKDIELTDQDGNHLTDNFGVHIGGRRWLINTDKTLTQANLPADAKAVGEALVTKPENYDIPILYLYGAGIEGMQSKKDSVSVGLSYKFPRFNLSGTLNKIKVQGSSSASLPKKNYTLQLDQAVELINGYGKQKKYVIKADMTDFSHTRNVGCAELWGKVRQTRIKADDAIKTNDTDYLVDNAGNHIVAETDPQLSIGGTYGSVDGFPIAVYINDKYWGLYTFNIPKDKGIAKMSKSKGHAIVSTVWASFNETTRLDGKDMDIEFCGTEESDWVFRSINALIDTVKASYDTKDDFTKVITPLLDIDSAIDYYVYSVAIGNVDGIVRNFNLQTWNGKKWYFAAYDLDMVFGRTPDLLDYLSPEYNGSSIRHGGLTFENMATGNRIFHQLWKFYKDEIIARYKDLASNVLSSANVGTFFTNYVKKIPVALKAQEDKTWPQTPLTESNNIDQIRWWYMYHINFLNRLVANA